MNIVETKVTTTKPLPDGVEIKGRANYENGDFANGYIAIINPGVRGTNTLLISSENELHAIHNVVQTLIDSIEQMKG